MFKVRSVSRVARRSPKAKILKHTHLARLTPLLTKRTLTTLQQRNPTVAKAERPTLRVPLSCAKLKKSFASTLYTRQIRFNHHGAMCTDHHEHAHVGGKAPAFECDALVGTEFKTVKLSDYTGKWVVLFFYPLDFTFVCPTEIIEFSEKAKEFRKINTEVIAASCDSKFSHLAWSNTSRKEGGLGKLDIPIIADFNKVLAKNYGALLLDKGFPLRALYIIDPKGVVRQITLNDTPVGRNVSEVLRLVQAFQHVEKHG